MVRLLKGKLLEALHPQGGAALALGWYRARRWRLRIEISLAVSRALSSRHFPGLPPGP
jgi:hypothetical protein